MVNAVDAIEFRRYICAFKLRSHQFKSAAVVSAGAESSSLPQRCPDDHTQNPLENYIGIPSVRRAVPTAASSRSYFLCQLLGNGSRGSTADASAL